MHKLAPYWIYISTRRMVFGLPCLFLLIESKGVLPHQMGYCLSAFAFSQILFEVPSGIASDRLGRKQTLLIGSFTRAFSWCLFSFSETYLLFIIGFAILGISFAFDSGTDSSILYDTLKEQNKEAEYPKYESRALTLSLLALGLSNLIGGFLIYSGLQTPVVVTAITMLFGIPITLYLYEPKFHKSNNKKEFFQKVKDGFKIVQINPKLRLIIITAVFALGFVEIYFRFIQQYLHTALNLDARYLGYVYFFWLLISATSSYFARYDFFRERVTFYILLIASLLAFSFIFLPLKSTLFSLLFTIVPQITIGIIPVFFRTEINKDLPSEVRATVLSVFGFLVSFLVVLVAPCFGFLEEKYFNGAGFLLLGVGMLIVNLFCIKNYLTSIK